MMDLFARAKERAAEVGSLGASSFGHVATSLTSSAASLGSAVGQLQVSNRAGIAGAVAKRLVKDLVTTDLPVTLLAVPVSIETTDFRVLDYVRSFGCCVQPVSYSF